METRREAHIAQLRAPLGGMSEETKALLLSDSGSEAEEAEEDEGQWPCGMVYLCVFVVVGVLRCVRVCLGAIDRSTPVHV